MSAQKIQLRPVLRKLKKPSSETLAVQELDDDPDREREHEPARGLKERQASGAA